MATEEGYDVEVLQDISSDLYCVICLKLMRNPVQFKCGHGMCYGCFRNLMQKTKQKSIAQCPQCREIVKENQVVSNAMLHRLILSLKVRCENSDNGCCWLGELDALEDHLERCTKVQDAEVGSKKMKKKKNIRKDKPVMEVSSSVQSDLLLEITGQLSALHNKIERLEEEKKNTTITDVGVYHNCKQYLKMFVARTTMNGSSYPMKIAIFVLTLLSLLILLSVNSDNTFEYVPLDLDNLQRAFSQLHSDLSKIHSQIYAQQNNFFQLHLVSKELRSDFDTQRSTFEEYVFLYWRNVILDVRYKKTLIAQEIDMVMSQQLEKVNLMEKRFDYAVKQLDVEIQEQNNSLLENTFKQVAVPNIIHLPHNYINETLRTLEKTIFQELEMYEASAEANIRQVFDATNKKFSSLQTHWNKLGIVEQLQKQHQQLHDDEIKSDLLVKEALGDDNMNKQIERIHRNYFLLRDGYQDNMEGLRRKYPSDSFSYMNRFKNAMSQLKNTNLKNGKYVWLMNSTLLPLLPGNHGYYSNEFTAVPSTSLYKPSKFAKLWLLRMSSENNFWKVTYEQEADTNVTIDISILNQLRQDDLKTVEVYRQLHENKLQLIVDYKIPLTLPDLVKRGYIYDGKIYIRCVVQTPSVS